MTPNLARDVFICHSFEDAEAARAICDGLEGGGISCWIAPRDPVPGIPYGKQLVDAIDSARIVLLVFSSAANQSRAVLNELELASNRAKIVLPVRIEDVLPSSNLEFYIRSIHWFDSAVQSLDVAVAELVDHVKQLLAQPRDSTDAQTAAASVIRSVNAPRHNLPSALTSFVGREREVAEIEGLLQSGRFVTLAGTGGVGKTRCVLKFGEGVLGRFRDGVRFVGLAEIADAWRVAPTVAAVFDLLESPNRPILDTLVAYLKRKELLLIVDNCEHVVGAAAEVVARLLRDCPGVRVIATSREPLGVEGEEVLRMPTLPQDEAVALFVARAQAAKRDFTLDRGGGPIVEEIVRRLDGIPLAIELAAARVRVLDVRQLNEKLVERFKLLTGGARTVLPRQQTLRALIDWSYGLLNDDETRAFRRLSLFAGGFTLELAHALSAAEGVGEYEVLDVVTSLVDKSLIQTEQNDDETRYRFLESTREFAQERLVECGEYAGTSRALAVALTELAESIEAEWSGNRGSEKVLRARRELENWRAALRWALREHGDVALGQRLAAVLRFAWARFGPAEGRRWVARALAESMPAEEVLARLLLTDAHLAMLQTQYKEGLSAGLQALAFHEAAGNRRLHAESQLMAGAAAGMLGRVEESERLLHAALDAFRALNAHTDAGSALQYLGVFRMNAGDISGSRDLYEQALDAYRVAGADALAAHMALQMAEVEFQEGNSSKALSLAQDALASDRARGDENSVFYDLCNIAAYELALGQPAEASSHAREALSLSSLTGSDAGLPFALQRLAAVAALHSSDRGRADELCRLAASILGFVDRSFEEFGFTRDYTEKQEYEHALAALDKTMGAQSRASGMAEGRSWTRERAIKAAETIAGDQSYA